VNVTGLVAISSDLARFQAARKDEFPQPLSSIGMFLICSNQQYDSAINPAKSKPSARSH
jgi:hypothetical protein